MNKYNINIKDVNIIIKDIDDNYDENYYYIYIDDNNIFNICLLNKDIDDIFIIINIINILKRFNINNNIDNKYILNYLDDIYNICDINIYKDLNNLNIIIDYMIYIKDNIK